MIVKSVVCVTDEFQYEYIEVIFILNVYHLVVVTKHNERANARSVRDVLKEQMSQSSF